MKTIKTLQQNGVKATVKFDSDWEEYVVEFEAGGTRAPDADYYTDDRADAIETAWQTIHNFHRYEG